MHSFNLDSPRREVILSPLEMNSGACCMNPRQTYQKGNPALVPVAKDSQCPCSKDVPSVNEGIVKLPFSGHHIKSSGDISIVKTFQKSKANV